MCDRQNRKRMSETEELNELMDSSEIKQEPSIKEEPQPVDRLEEFSALNNHGDRPSLIDLSRNGDDVNSMDLSIDEVKIEVKDESNKKNGKSSKLNDARANEEAMDSQQAKHPSRSNTPKRKINQKNRAGSNAENANKFNVQERDKKQHQCKQCKYATKYKSALEKHLVKHTGETSFQCNHCAKAFKSKNSLQNHMKMHVEDFLFSCAVCLKGFDKKNDKMAHEINCKTLRYECHLCKKSFVSKRSNLINHMRVHCGERPFVCTECPKKFTQKVNFKSHIQLHDGPRSFHCSICRQRFSQEDEKIAHQQKCNRRVYECYVCGKSFGMDKSNLSQHMRTHTGDKPFECSQCSNKFTRKSNLNEHMIIHSRSLPLKCAICHEGFAKQIQWIAHQRNCRRRVYECFDCKQFIGSRSNQLKIHMTKHSGEKAVQCEICSKGFTQKSNLIRHIKSIHK